MNSSDYKIIISISHQRISFEYWLKGTEPKLCRLPGGSWPAPLAFYASPSRLVIGSEAVRAVKSGTSNAFDNYFKRIVTEETYILANQVRPLRNILLDAAEIIFSEFFRSIQKNRLGQLTDNRASMPLTIVCEPDISPDEGVFLKNLFKDSGYNHVNTARYDRLIGRYIRNSLAGKYNCANVLVVWSDGADLSLSIYGLHEERVKAQASFAGLGIDPRKELVKNIIWERVSSQNPWLWRLNEEEIIEDLAVSFLNGSLPLVNDKVTLSDGHEYVYSLNRNEIDFLPNEQGAELREKLNFFLSQNGIIDRSNTLLLLRGTTARNPYFEQNLSHGFMRTIVSDDKLRDDVMRQIIEGLPSDDSYSVPPRSTASTASIRETGFSDILKKMENLKGETPIKTPVIENSTPPLDAATKALQKEWREIKATANGKDRAGNRPEAVRLLTEFLRKCSMQTSNKAFLSEIKALIDSMSSIRRPASNPTPGPVPKPTRSKSLRQTTSINTVRQPSPPPIPEISEGEKLIKAGKLKEARDWYRENGNASKARILSDIIRAKKSVETRKNSLEDYRKSKNSIQIERIIKELEDYVGNCRKAGIPADEYRRLMIEYKSIK